MRNEKQSGKTDSLLMKRVVDFTLSADYTTLPESMVKLAKQAILDTVGVSIAGWKEPAVEIAKKVYAPTNGDGNNQPSSLWGEDMKVSPQQAAVINGTASHALDYDDALADIILHPSAPALAAIITVAEKLKCSGKEVVTAYAVGTEVMIRMAQMVGLRHYRIGWHATGTIGTLGATAATSYLWQLDRTQCINAIAIACSMAGGLRKNFGSMTKPLHVGLAASNAIQAVHLAHQHFTGNGDIFEDQGFLNAFTGWEYTKEYERIIETTTFGDPFELLESGLSVKKFPCCFGTHRFIQGALELKAEHQLTLDSIEKITLRAQRKSLLPLVHHSPTNGLEGKFSAEYTVLAAIKDGYVDLNSFEDESVKRKDIQQLIPAVEVIEKEEEQSQKQTLSRLPIDIEIHTKNSEVYTKTVQHAPGSKEHPMTNEEQRQKWKSCLLHISKKQHGEVDTKQVETIADDLYDKGLQMDTLPFIGEWLKDTQIIFR